MIDKNYFYGLLLIVNNHSDNHRLSFAQSNYNNDYEQKQLL